jgi:hypothetical protein
MKGVWLARSRLILDLLEHLPHVGEAKFPGVVLPEYMKLATGDLIPFDTVLFGVERAHVRDKPACQVKAR